MWREIRVAFDEQLINVELPHVDTEALLRFNKYVRLDFLFSPALITNASSTRECSNE